MTSMQTEIIVALIAAGASLFGSVLTIIVTSAKTSRQMEINQAVTNTKIEELTREVRAHNNFAQRIPVVEEQIRVANHRIADLERSADPIRQD